MGVETRRGFETIRLWGVAREMQINGEGGKKEKPVGAVDFWVIHIVSQDYSNAWLSTRWRVFFL